MLYVKEEDLEETLDFIIKKMAVYDLDNIRQKYIRKDLIKMFDNNKWQGKRAINVISELIKSKYPQYMNVFEKILLLLK